MLAAARVRSLPQKDAQGQRTDAEAATFGRGLKVMGFLYASIGGTAVAVRKAIPPNPAGSDDGTYNDTPYDRRGWTRFEEGAARLVAAHVAQAAAQARGEALPEKLELAGCAPKLVGIDAESGGVSEAGVADPRRVLRETTRAIGDPGRTRFTGKGDRQLVQQMLAELDWVMLTSVDQLVEVLSEHEAEPDPALMRAGRAAARAATPAVGGWAGWGGWAAQAGGTNGEGSGGGEHATPSSREESGGVELLGAHAPRS